MIVCVLVVVHILTGPIARGSRLQFIDWQTVDFNSNSKALACVLILMDSSVKWLRFCESNRLDWCFRFLIRCVFVVRVRKLARPTGR